MKLGIFFLLIINTVFGQVVGPEKKPGLSVELSANASRVRMSDQVVLTVYFRSPSRRTTMWNALSWGAPAGLYLQVLDSSGREVRNDFSPFYHPVPPDLTGKE